MSGSLSRPSDESLGGESGGEAEAVARKAMAAAAAAAAVAAGVMVVMRGCGALETPQQPHSYIYMPGEGAPGQRAQSTSPPESIDQLSGAPCCGARSLRPVSLRAAASRLVTRVQP